MHTYECSSCGMTVNASCGACNVSLKTMCSPVMMAQLCRSQNARTTTAKSSRRSAAALIWRAHSADADLQRFASLYNRASKPTVRPDASWIFLTCEHDSGMKLVRSYESCRMVSVCSLSTENDLLVGGHSSHSHRMNSNSVWAVSASSALGILNLSWIICPAVLPGCIILAVASAVPDGAPIFSS